MFYHIFFLQKKCFGKKEKEKRETRGKEKEDKQEEREKENNRFISIFQIKLIQVDQFAHFQQPRHHLN